jgi:hypothetical protein
MPGGKQELAAWEIRETAGGVKLVPFMSLRHSPGVIDLAVLAGGSELVLADRAHSLYAYEVAHAVGPQLLVVTIMGFKSVFVLMQSTLYVKVCALELSELQFRKSRERRLCEGRPSQDPGPFFPSRFGGW